VAVEEGPFEIMQFRQEPTSKKKFDKAYTIRIMLTNESTRIKCMLISSCFTSYLMAMAFSVRAFILSVYNGAIFFVPDLPPTSFFMFLFLL
jgi:hypothetical protein